jgi:hypothetical protein
MIVYTGISEMKPIPSPELIRQSSVKQIAREKRFLSELFLPLLNEKLKPDVLDFIKEEVTMQLNLKVYIMEINLHICMIYMLL